MSRPAARLLIPALRWREDTGFAHETDRIAEALALGVGGFILFGGTADAVQALTASLQAQAGRLLLIASDLERGTGQQVQGAVEIPPPLALAQLDDPAVPRWAGACTAREAKRLGINWAFAPVADLDLLAENPIVQTRSFGAAPARVADAVRAWVEGCQGIGVLACAKHYPGHGRTRRDSHEELPVVTADRAELETTDLMPFRAAIDARVGSLMTAHVAYPALDASGLPATLSAPILRELRARHGFLGLIVTDALNMAGAQQGRTEAEASVQALAAGADVLLYPDDPAGVVAAIEMAIADGRVPESRLHDALVRIGLALEWLQHPRADVEGYDAKAAAVIAGRVVRMLRGTLPALRLPLELEIVDDDIGGPYAPASASTLLEAALREAGVPLGPGGSVVRCLFSEPRAWKGRAGLGPVALAALREGRTADLHVLFGHPRFLAELPGDGPVLLAWHRQALLQRAVAARLRAATD